MKNLRKSILIIVFILGIFSINAQDKTKREKMEALKISYITEKLDLTTAEAEKFWPIYNDYKTAKKEMKSKKGSKKPNIEEMTDIEVESLINERIQKEQSILNLRKEYIGKFKTVLPIKKVAKLLQAEKEFRREIIKKMKETK